MLRLYKVFSLLAVLVLATGAQADGDIGPEVGQQAPAFQLTDLDGKSVSLTDLTQKGYTMLIFWSTRCHFCHAMIPEFKRIYTEYQKKGLSVAAINIGYETQPDVEAYALEFDLTYPVLNDDEKKEYLSEAYALVGTPTITVVSPAGTVVYRGHFLPKDLDGLLQERKVSIK
jgi:peroxiredoxin